jgi:hypothetical protein
MALTVYVLGPGVVKLVITGLVIEASLKPVDGVQAYVYDAGGENLHASTPKEAEAPLLPGAVAPTVPHLKHGDLFHQLRILMYGHQREHLLQQVV